MKCQRQLLQISWQQFIRNDEVAVTTGLPSISEVIINRRSALFGHVARLHQDVPAHKALHCHVDLSLGRPPNDQWKRRPGRPRERWIDQVRKEVLESPPPSGSVEAWDESWSPRSNATALLAGFAITTTTIAYSEWPVRMKCSVACISCCCVLYVVASIYKVQYEHTKLRCGELCIIIGLTRPIFLSNSLGYVSAKNLQNWMTSDYLKACPHCRRKCDNLSQKVRQFVAEKWDCRTKVRLSPKAARQRRNSATVALFCDSVVQA